MLEITFESTPLVHMVNWWTTVRT